VSNKSRKPSITRPGWMTFLTSPGKAILAVGALIAAVITIWSLGAWVREQVGSWYENTPQAEATRLGKLVPGIQVEVFNDLMGMKPQVCNRRGQYTSCTYIKRYEFVQTAIDSNDQVLAFAVITRSLEFTPTLSWAGFPVTLGKTTIEDAMPDGAQVAAYVDMPTFGYLEKSQSIQVANFQVYAVGVTSAGYGANDDSILGVHEPVAEVLNKANFEQTESKERSNEPWPSKIAAWLSPNRSHKLLQSTEVKAFRHRGIVNTFAIAASGVDVTELPQIMPDQTVGLLESP
jgi:hypothetical protein